MSKGRKRHFRAKKKKKKQIEFFEGRVDMTKTGIAYVICADLKSDVKVPSKYTNRAFHGDTVLVETTFAAGQQPKGKIIKVLKRAREIFIGEVDHYRENAFIVLRGISSNDVFVPKSKLNGAEDGDVVKVKILEWSAKDKNPLGEVIEVLDDSDEHELAMQSILVEQGFELEFPEDVIAQSEAINAEIDAKTIENRLDLRNVTTFTIDPHDAKDFDDALSVRKLENGNWEIGVHIADVSHYIEPDSVLDQEAFHRSTSVYLVDRVCPMIPERLSNFICSLRPEEEKCTFSVLFEFDAKHKVVNHTYAKTVINSDKRFTYEEAQQILDDKAGLFYDELQLLDDVSKHLRKKRFDNHSIDFDAAEVKFRLDENNLPYEVYVKDRIDTNMLIEEFMLLANVSVAQFISKLRPDQKKKIPVPYRVHDQPDATRLANLAQIAKKFGHQVSFPSTEGAAPILNTLLAKVKGKPEEYVIQQLAIRSMAKAEYTTKNIGHYGLAFEHYCHFTSPIRRYPDIITHRVLAACINEQFDLVDDAQDMEEQCKQCSLQERKAISAERESIRYKQVEYMSHHKGDVFEGVISGVIARGFFVEFTANKCEGFVPASEISGEPFYYDEETLSLIGTHTNTRYQFGDQATVQIVSADTKRLRVECRLVSED